MRLLLFLSSALLCTAAPLKNVIIIFTDDQGYNDLGCFGSDTIKTPHLDQMAQEGRKFTSFYVAAPVCSPSRAALLTGCYPKRIGLEKGVLFPTSNYGLNPKEYTLADHFSSHGYLTACIGKWHLGHLPEVLPTANGFHSYYGIPYSNDMNHPDNKGKPQMDPKGMDQLWSNLNSTLTKWKTPLLENEKIIELPVDQRTITRRYTDRALDFIQKSTASKKPFFLYLPHSMPHIPLYLPEDAWDPNPKNAYRNVIQHLDQQIGRILTQVRNSELAKNTLIIFTSDNGPWLTFKHHGGSAKPLRNGKTTNFEGGQRVPCIMWAPGTIPANTTSQEMLSTLELLPTLASLTQTHLPKNHSCDGYNATQTITGTEPSPRTEFLYYATHGKLTGIRQNNWKLLRLNKKNSQTPEIHLFNLADDLSETTNLAKQNPRKVETLIKRMTTLDAEITAQQRPAWSTQEN